MAKKILILLCFILNLGLALAQRVVLNPSVAELSHPELVIDKISFYADSTVVNLTVENKLDKGGWFCADRNIYIENPQTRQRFVLKKSVGIPTCPNNHSFGRKGEKLSFTLVFPYVPSDLRTLNLVEDCNKSCFSFRGIILDDKLNADIKTFNQGMDYYSANRTDKAIECFAKVIETIPAFPTHVYGYAYYHLVIIHLTKGDKETAKYWFDGLEKSSLPDKQYFIDEIKRNKGIPK